MKPADFLASCLATRDTISELDPRRRCPFTWPPAPAADLRFLQYGEIVRSLVATIFGRATLVLPSCDRPFTGIVYALVTGIVYALAMLTQRARSLSLIG
jgi:hypothetical protein